jgi:hypothetical protein
MMQMEIRGRKKAQKAQSRGNLFIELQRYGGSGLDRQSTEKGNIQH